MLGILAPSQRRNIVNNRNNKAGTQGNEELAVIGIEIPSPKWMGVVPAQGGVVFGRHYAQIDQDMKKLLISCDGTVELCAVGKNKIQSLSEGEPIEIRCTRCGFSHIFAENWKESTLEWMRITFALAMDTIFNYSEGPEDENFGLAAHDVKICVPNYNNRLYTVPPTPERPQWEDRRVLAWKEHGIAVYTKFNFDVKNLRALVINAALLMTELEQIFQNAIKRSAQLAASASEPFHFNTRR